MKKLFLPIAIILLLALAACGSDPSELVDQAGDAATRLAEEAGDVAATAAAVATDIADGPDNGEPEGGAPTVTEDGPMGETFTVDPTQPIEVEDSSGTQIKFGDDPFTDENGNPPAGDVNINVFTSDMADEGDEAEGSPDCEEPGTSDVLTVWRYDEVTGLWVEEEPAPIADNRCVEPVGTVSVDVSDDEGNEYDLADGKTAEVTIPCEPTPDQVMTVWSYNEETGLWEEDDDPIVIEGKTCSAEVSDPSNVVFGTKEEAPVLSTLQGQVVDFLTGEALVGAAVCVGFDCIGLTDSSGFYTFPDLPAGEYLFQVVHQGYFTAEQTIDIVSGETLTQDFALTAETADPVLHPLDENVILRGTVVAIDFVEDGTVPVAINSTYEFFKGFWSFDFPQYNLLAGDETLIVHLNGSNGGLANILVPKLSDTELGKAANDGMLDAILYVTAITDGNQAILANDVMEVVLIDPNSSSLPYTVNFYRGEARELVATFTINRQ